MRLAVYTELKDTYTMLPLEMKIKLMEGTAAFITKYKQAGVCKEIYSLAARKGSISIWEVESEEKGAELILENPLSPFQSISMYPASDFDTHMKASIEMLKKMQAK